MRLFNNGLRKIVVAGQDIQPKALFEVADKEGKKLMELFAGEIIEPIAAVAKEDKSKQLKADLDEANAKIKELETQLADFEAIKAERDEAKKAVEKLEGQIEKLKQK